MAAKTAEEAADAALSGATAPKEATRRATRNEPIPVSFDIGKGATASYEVTELPWRKRNDLGELVLGTYTQALNNLITVSGQEDGAARMDSTLFEAHIDYAGILAMAFPDNEQDDFDPLTFDQMVELVTEALKINGFDRLVHMVNPKELDRLIGESASATGEPIPDGQKTESATNSG